MPQLEIESLDDPRLAPYRSLKASNETRWSGQFVVEGTKLVERLLASRFRPISIVVARSKVDRLPAVRPDELPVYVLADEMVSQLVGYKFHYGMLACARRRTGQTLADLCRPIGEATTVVVCPDVQDPENLGSILRSASALGADGVLLGPEAGNPFSRRVMRVSMGAALRLPIVESSDLAADLQSLRRDSGLALWATVLDADATPLSVLPRPARLAVLFGSEGHGLARPLVDACSQRVTIPMTPGVDSLNVAVAAGIVLHYILRAAASD